MSDPMTPKVGDWMKRTDAEPPSAQECARRVIARLPEVRQRRRWWPVPLVYRKPSLRPTTHDSTAYELSPNQATDGPNSTVIGRTKSMLSPAKTITAGVLVFAIGGAMLIAQPFGPEATVPGAAPDGPAMAPSFFSGDAGADASYLLEPTSETRPDGVVVETSILSAQWATNDPRIDGLMTNYGSTLDYGEGALGDSPTGVTGAVGPSLVRVVNDDGAWEGTLDFLAMDGVGTDLGSGWLVGEDAYEGLVAYVVIDYSSPCCKLSGHITSEGRPLAPEAFPEQ